MDPNSSLFSASEDSGQRNTPPTLTDKTASSTQSSLEFSPPVPLKLPPPVPQKMAPPLPPKDNFTGMDSLRYSGTPLPYSLRRAMTSPVTQRYPLTVTDLTKADLKLLTAVLNIENKPEYAKKKDGSLYVLENAIIKTSIDRLPGHLQRSLLFRLLPSSGHRAAVLCNSHKSFNGYIIGHIFDLLKKEVTENLQRVDQFSDGIETSVMNLVRSLQAIRGMWWTPTALDLLPPVGAAAFQDNKCEACMLGRIVTEPMFLRNLRATLLSRTRTRSKHQVPRLHSFIEEGINIHREDAYRLFVNSSNMAFDFKKARKQAVRAYKAERRQLLREIGHSTNRKNDSQSIVVYLAPGANKSQQSDHQEDDDDNNDDDTRETEFTRRNYARDTVDEIIASYGRTSSMEYSYPSSIPDTEGLPTITPLSVKKAPNSSVYSSRVGSRRHSLPGSIPPRERVNWLQALNKQSPLEALAEGVKALLGEGTRSSGANGNSEEFAQRYRHILGPRVGDETASIDSRGSMEDAPVKQSGPEDTTWSLVCSSSMPAKQRRFRKN